MVTGNFDAASGLSGDRAGGIQGAAHTHRATLPVAQQPDYSVVVLDGLRFDDAGVVNCALQQARRRFRGQQHLATIGLDQAAIPCQRVHRALIYRDVEQAISGNIERDGVAGSERHRAEPGDDGALVAYVGAQQRDIAAVGVDGALIQYRSSAAAGKLVSASHEVAVADVEGGGNQTPDIHLRALAEQDAIRIDQEYLAVGQQAAEDARRIRSQHPVEGDRIAVGLNEANHFALADAETLPVDRHILA